MGKEIFSRCLSEDYIRNLVKNSDNFLFIYEKPEWIVDERDRTFKCLQSLGVKKAAWIQYKSEAQPYEGLTEQFQFSIDSLEAGTITFSDNAQEMRGFWKIIREQCGYSSLIIDITRMNVRMLSAMVSFLPEYKWESIFFCYSEPGEYKKENGTFNLHNVCDGFGELPGLETCADYSEGEYEWVVFLGFDGGRINQLETEVDPKIGYEKPVVCIPPMQAEWHNHAIVSNLDFFVERRKAEKLKYVSAINPFDVYNLLVKLKGELRETDKLLISPLSTKVTALGTIMYVLVNPDDRTLTDNPRQTENGSCDAGRSHYYDLTEFIGKAKNERYF